jgi:antitoxin PrlF
MEVARVTTKGQVTIPIAIRKLMNIKEGDKIVFFEENGRIFVENAALLAFNRIQEEMKGEAEKAGFSSEEELQTFANEIRQELWEKKYANND